MEVCFELGGTGEVCKPESSECLVFIFLMVMMSSSSGIVANLLFAALPKRDLFVGPARVIPKSTIEVFGLLAIGES